MKTAAYVVLSVAVLAFFGYQVFRLVKYIVDKVKESKHKKFDSDDSN